MPLLPLGLRSRRARPKAEKTQKETPPREKPKRSDAATRPQRPSKKKGKRKTKGIDEARPSQSGAERGRRGIARRGRMPEAKRREGTAQKGAGAKRHGKHNGRGARCPPPKTRNKRSDKEFFKRGGEAVIIKRRPNDERRPIAGQSEELAG